MMDETVTSCLRPLLEGLTFTPRPTTHARMFQPSHRHCVNRRSLQHQRQEEVNYRDVCYIGDGDICDSVKGTEDCHQVKYFGVCMVYV